MTRNLETRLHRLEQRRQQPRNAREPSDATELLGLLGIDMKSFIRLANSVDAKDQQPPDDCTPAERRAWHYLRDVLHFDRLPI